MLRCGTQNFLFLFTIRSTNRYYFPYHQRVEALTDTSSMQTSGTVHKMPVHLCDP